MSMIGNFAGATDIEIARLLARPGTITAYLDDDREGLRRLDVEKAWHGIHFLLTGEGWGGQPPLDFIASGGELIGDVDVGYGPARAFTSDEVRAIAAALAPLSWSALMQRWDADAIRSAQIYGVDPDSRDAENEYLGFHYERLKAFVTALAGDGLGMIVYLD